MSAHYTCDKCGYTTDVAAAMREHHMRTWRGYDPCKPSSLGDCYDCGDKTRRVVTHPSIGRIYQCKSCAHNQPEPRRDDQA